MALEIAMDGLLALVMLMAMAMVMAIAGAGEWVVAMALVMALAMVVVKDKIYGNTIIRKEQRYNLVKPF